MDPHASDRFRMGTSVDIWPDRVLIRRRDGESATPEMVDWAQRLQREMLSDSSQPIIAVRSPAEIRAILTGPRIDGANRIRLVDDNPLGAA